jgi:hypothetical protein
MTLRDGVRPDQVDQRGDRDGDLGSASFIGTKVTPDGIRDVLGGAHAHERSEPPIGADPDEVGVEGLA